MALRTSGERYSKYAGGHEIMNQWIERKDLIPEWLILGRTVLLPKVKDLSSEKDYQPITCLNTSFKIFTGVLGSYMKKNAVRNDI